MKNKLRKYSNLQKLLSVVLLFSVLATTLFATGYVFGDSFNKVVKAEISGTITSFLNVPTEPISVDAGTLKADIAFPKMMGAVVEKDGMTKNVYFDAVWESEAFSDKTALSTDYTFTLAESCIPCSVDSGVSIPEITVKSGKYRICGFEEISPDLIAKSIVVGETLEFPKTVEAYVGCDTATTSVSVSWVSDNETIQGGASKTYSEAGTKIAYKAQLVETDKYYLATELTDKNIAEYTIPCINVYVISNTVAFVGEGGFPTLADAYNHINLNGGSGTIVINDFYSYYVDSENYDPFYTVIGQMGDNYSDSFFHEPAHSGLIVIKGNTPDAVLEFSYRFYMAGDLMFKDITLKTKYSMKERIYANGHDLIMGTGITCTWDDNLTENYVESFSNAFRIYGGSATTDLYADTKVVLLSGDFYLVRGGNEEGGTVYGDTYVYLGGTAHTYYQLMGGSRRGTITGSTYVIVGGDAVADAKSGGTDSIEGVAVFGGGLEGTVNGDKDGDGTVEGGCHVIVYGGTLNAAVTGSGANETYKSKTYVAVCGSAVINAGSQGAIFGVGDGSQGSVSENDILINVFCNARLLKKDSVYGHIYGTNTLNNVNSDITINVFGNAFVEGSVNGGAYAANSGIGNESTGKKTVNVNVYGKSTVRFNVYGGSLRKGIYGDSHVVIKDSATVQGNVYAGGQGAASVSTSNQYGSAFNTTLYIENNASVNYVFGGANYGYNMGDSTITVKNAVIKGSVYGGSCYAGVKGKSTVNITQSKVAGDVFGGNENEGVIYANNESTYVNLSEGTVVEGSVYGGGRLSAAGVTNVNLTDVTVKGSVYGGSEENTSSNTNISVMGNTQIVGNIYGAGKNGNSAKSTINVNSGFVKDIYGGGETSYSQNVEINISGTENEFTFDIKGEIDGLPQNPISESDIAANFTSNSSYVLNFAKFGGYSGKTFSGCGAVSAISNFSEVNINSSALTFVGTTGEYFTGITALNLSSADSKLELPGKATIKSAFTNGGVYSTTGTNVLPSTFNATRGSALAMPARTLTDAEQMEAEGAVSSIFTVYGKVTGICDLFVDGEKKSGTYITSFLTDSNVGAEIDNATSDYLYKNREGVMIGNNKNFSVYMASGFDTGAFKLDGLNEVHDSDRVFTTIKNGLVGTLDEQNTSNWVIWEGESFANIALYKQGEVEIDGNTAPLSGVEFTVYADKECTNAIETIVTDEKGYAITSDLSAKDVTYYVKETKTKDNYKLDSKVYSVKLTNDDSGKVVGLTEDAIINYLKYGEISVVKTSDDGVLLEGVVFEVVGQGFSKRIITDAAGYATTGKILLGTYTVREITNPNPGFVAPSYETSVTVSEQEANITLDVTNNRVTGKVTLNKVGEKGENLADVVFNVYSDSTLENLVDTIITNENGYAETKALTIYGASTTYYVKEATTIDGYVLRDDVFSVTLTPDSNVGLAADVNDRVIKNYLKKANIAISKKGENDALLEGVEFGIYSDAECTNLVETIITDNAGSAVSEELKLGTYYVKELSNPDKTYILSDDVYIFELSEHNKVYTKTVYNVKAGAYITLEKVDSNNKAMAGVKFEIRDVDGVVIETITTDENGKAISSALTINVGEENLFTVVEVEAPDYVYLNDTIFEAILTNDNQIFALNGGEPIVNKIKEGYLTLEKVGESGEKLQGVEFTVYTDSALKNAVGTIITDENGKGVSNVLPFGTYFVKETLNPDKSYVIAPDVYTVELNDSKGENVNGKLFVPVSERPIVNFRATGCISILKTDEEGKPLADVEFTIYDSDMNPISTVYTDKDGKVVTCRLVIKDGVNGTKYYVAETATVSEYRLDGTKYEAILKDDGAVVAINGGNAIVNYFKRGQISVTKKNEIGSPLAGVEFTVYTDSSCTNAVETIVTNADGKGISSYLKLGTYYVKETKNPDKAYVVTDNVWAVTLNEDGAVKELTKTPVVNFFKTGCISIIKTDENGNPLAGVEFTIYDSNMNPISTVYTAADGKVVTCNLVIKDGENGTKYYVGETATGAEYRLDGTKYEAILKEHGAVVAINGGNAIVNYFKKGQISVTKQNELGKPLAGVEFTVYTDSSCTNAIETIVTNADGKGTSKSLKLGTYYVKETNNPDKAYVVTDNVWAVTLNEDGAVKELTATPVTNFYKTGCISIIKTDENGKPLAGVEFTIYDSAMNPISTVYTAADGKVVTCNLVIKDGENGTKYYVGETATGAEYRLDDTKYEAILKEHGAVVAINGGNAIVNYFKKGQISVTKQSEEGKPLAGVEFTVYADSDCTEAIETIVTDANGKAISAGLKLGTYYVKETKAIAPFVPVYDVWAVTLDADNSVKELTATPIINYFTYGKITLTKTDENGAPLSGVEFQVFTLSGALVETLVTDANGVAVSGRLPIKNAEGTVYTVVESKGIYGYKMNTTPYDVILKNDGETVAVNNGNPIINEKIHGKLTVSYDAVGDVDGQELTVVVTVNGAPYVGKYTVGDNTFETTDGKVVVTDGYVFQIDMECGNTYVVSSESGELINVVGVSYNGENVDSVSGMVDEENLEPYVEIVVEFDIPAKPGDKAPIFVFSILAAISAFGLVVLEGKKRRIRG